ncbi:hypothetical protein JXQ70_19065 [bacterium]|nr:hypothetical protein [bacterium]
MTINTSTINGNTALGSFGDCNEARGGGIHNTGIITINLSTITGNNASGGDTHANIFDNGVGSVKQCGNRFLQTLIKTDNASPIESPWINF